MKSFSITNPHPEHRPNVFRIFSGSRPQGGRCFASGMTCSCGWRPSVDRIFGRNEDGTPFVRERPNSKFCNEPPSSSLSKHEAKLAYLRHLAELGLIESGTHAEGQGASSQE